MNSALLQPRPARDLAADATEPRLRICVVTETWPPEVNGVAMTIHRLVAWLGERHDVTLVRVRQRGTDVGLQIPGVETVLMPGVPVPRYHGLRMGTPSVGRLKALWRNDRPDVVHMITEGPLGWSAVRAATALGIPVVSDFHTNFHQYATHYGLGLFQRPALSYLRGLHNRTRLTLVPTRALADDLERRGFRQLDVLSRGIDTERFSPSRRRDELRRSWGAGPEDSVLLMVSRIAPEKNLPLALRAFDAARERVPGTRMVVVGDGPARAALARAHPEVLFAGMRTGTDLAEHYASADIFVFPSRSETFGNVTLEAMASGLAVVAFDYAAAREHLADGRNGRSLPTTDDPGFIQAVADLAADRRETRRLAAAGRSTALEIDWSQVCIRYEALLRRATENPDD
ncbi:glycosyltransferase family 4 protein [Thioalkalivibrio paradoxus]|uniref:Glycosyl transferase n=1 Tax=Thioalkalivibrio paradoxus ARh 1 TaxID=713585 RepID=W0DP71_9GAMM|nr:glycosyltransferase family 1 protein [Thioalkalivibrio paradoxus]AHE98788.1 glycosyl transferase [Thioalkalivibrio paradoxus ARh 1]